MNVIYGRVKQALRVEETATRKQRPLSAKEAKEKERDESEIRWEVEHRQKRAEQLWSLRGLRREIWEERQFAAIEKEAKKWARLEMARQLVDDLDPISSETFAILVDLPKYEEVERIANSRRNPYCQSLEEVGASHFSSATEPCL